MKTLFATDFDGTLFRSDRTIGIDDLEALRDLRASEVVTVLATGRSPYSLSKATQGLPLPFDWLILSSGAGMISESGEVVTYAGLSVGDITYIRAFLENHRYDYSVQGPFPDSHHLYHGPGIPHSDHSRRREYYNGFVLPVDRLTGTATQFVIYLDPASAEDDAAKIGEALRPSFQVIRTTSPLDHSTVWLEIFPRGVHKGAAMLALAERLGIPGSRTAALGNDWNDRLLLECAGTAFKVSGSPPGLAPGATVVPCPDQNAVRHAARIWMEMNR